LPSRRHPVVRLETDKALYRAGEPVKVSLTNNMRDMWLAIDLARQGKAIRSEFLRMVSGLAAVAFPYDKQFDGELTVAAYSFGERTTAGYDYISDSRGAIPARQGFESRGAAGPVYMPSRGRGTLRHLHPLLMATRPSKIGDAPHCLRLSLRGSSPPPDARVTQRVRLRLIRRSSLRP
jgi:hypothetical protein